jgi:hypothetical protein
MTEHNLLQSNVFLDMGAILVTWFFVGLPLLVVLLHWF